MPSGYIFTVQSKFISPTTMQSPKRISWILFLDNYFIPKFYIIAYLTQAPCKTKFTEAVKFSKARQRLVRRGHSDPTCSNKLPDNPQGNNKAK